MTDHVTLQRLPKEFGITGYDYQLFQVYLAERSGYGTVHPLCSETRQLNCVVPQGISLKPMLFSLFTSELKHGH